MRSQPGARRIACRIACPITRQCARRFGCRHHHSGPGCGRGV